MIFIRSPFSVAAAAAVAGRHGGELLSLIQVERGTQPFDSVHQSFRKRAGFRLLHLPAQVVAINGFSRQRRGQNAEAGLTVEVAKRLTDVLRALAEGRFLGGVGFEPAGDPVEPV